MSPEIELEMYFLFHSFLMGILITVLYDILRILRRILPHNILAVSVEDFLYWIVCSLLVFVTTYCREMAQDHCHAAAACCQTSGVDAEKV